MSLLRPFSCFLLALGLPGCGDKADGGSGVADEVEADADTDADSDADADADADTDSDTDTDSDADTDADSDSDLVGYDPFEVPHARIVGQRRDALVGYHLDAGGDTNGDGSGEIVYKNGGNNTIYLLMGPVSAGDQAPWGEVTMDNGGRFLGDLDGDGYGDLLVFGSDNGHVQLGPFSGHINGDDGLSLRDAPLTANTGARMGDYDGDGTVDLLFGDRFDTTGGATSDGDGAGAAWVLRGTPDREPDEDDILLEVFGSDPGGWFGRNVVGPGDLDGDGFDEVFVWADWYGGWYLFHGPTSGSLRDTDADAVFQSGIGDGDWADALVGLPDVDGDGTTDFAVTGSPLDADGLEGAVYIVTDDIVGEVGAADAFTTLATSPGDRPSSRLGTTLAVLDANNDGLADLAIEGSGVRSDEDSSQLWIVLAPMSPGLHEGPENTLRFEAEREQAPLFGQRLRSGVDLDHDGLDDLLSVDLLDSTVAEEGGAIWILFGSGLQELEP